jgi:hypothetical protein
LSQLSAEVLDIARDQVGRVGPDLEGEVLGVDPERVESERLENRVPLEPLESSIYVVARKCKQIPDMQPFG